MAHTLAASLAVLALSLPATHAAAQSANDPVAPSAAVAAAWKQEAPKPAPALRALLVSYAGAQAFDLVTTIHARRAGAVEVNPLLRGSYAQATATKAALATATMLAARSVAKQHPKGAIVMMIVANVATSAVAAHNLQVARRSTAK